MKYLFRLLILFFFKNFLPNLALKTLDVVAEVHQAGI